MQTEVQVCFSHRCVVQAKVQTGARNIDFLWFSFFYFVSLMVTQREHAVTPCSLQRAAAVTIYLCRFKRKRVCHCVCVSQGVFQDWLFCRLHTV